MKRIAFLVVAACGGSGPTPNVPKAAPPDPLEPVADALAKDALDAGETASVTIGIARKDGSTWVKAYGEADRATHTRATRDTVYRIGSLTKQFTAAAILQLADQGKLSLDDDISKYVTVNTGGRKVTLKQLLTHTSGVPSYTDRADFPEWAKKRATPQQIVDLATQALWEFEPGSHFHYSNTGYVLLGMVIEKASNQQYANYIRDHVVAAAGLQHTFYCDDAKTPDRARGYEAKDGALVDAAPLDLSTPYSAGALCSTVPDLLAWNAALAGGKVVSPVAYADMITPPTEIKTDYGFALVVDRVEGHREIWHNGGINGFVSELHTFPDDGVTIAVLTNSEAEAAPRIEKKLAYAALGIASKDVALPAEERDAVVGVYDVQGVGPTAIVLEHNRLLIAPSGQGKVAIDYRGGDKFEIPELGVKLEFKRGADGKVASMVVEQGGQKLEAPRQP